MIWQRFLEGGYYPDVWPGRSPAYNRSFPRDAGVHSCKIYLSLQYSSFLEVVGPVGYDPTTYRLKGDYSTN